MKIFSGLELADIRSPNSSVRRAYYAGFIPPQHGKKKITYIFAALAAGGIRFDTQEAAQLFCAERLEAGNITSPSLHGGEFLCKDWQIERLESGDYVIFCEGPFILDNRRI